MSAPCTNAEIDAIRSASRTIVRELGFMRSTLAGAKLSPSAVHTLIEIGEGRVDNAGALASLLKLEKSTVSRLLQGLGARGLIASAVDAVDGRLHRLTLTQAGWRQLQEIEAYARGQVRSAIGDAPAKTRSAISKGLSAYATALRGRRARAGRQDALRSPVKITAGYLPTLLGRVTEMHAAYYARNYDFGSVFERKVAAEMAEFLGRLDGRRNAVFSAVQSGRIVGSVSIDGEDLGGDAAHLRWFIVDDEAKGMGLGKMLIASALDFVDRNGFSKTNLWTFKGLDAARHLYERAGFALEEEKPGQQWGTVVLEQMFIRPTPA